MQSRQHFITSLIPFILIIWISCLTPSFGQSRKSVKKTFDIANQYFNAGDLDNARVYYQQVLDVDSTSAEASFRIAECYRQTKNFRFAEIFYGKAFRLDPVSYKDGLFYKALMEKYQASYPASVDHFNAFLKLSPTKEMEYRAGFERNGAQLALDHSKKPERDFQFEIVPRPVSTKYSEISVSIAGDDQHIVVHADRDGVLSDQSFERNEDQWEVAADHALSDVLNSSQEVGAGTFNHAEDVYYFSQFNNNAGNSRLYQTILRNGVWQAPLLVELEYIDGPYHYEDPTLTPRGDTLIFSSDIPGGMGGLDLWYATKDADGNWGIIQNMGEPVNTPFDEKSAFYYSKDRGLFFSSNGHVGYGHLDVFFIHHPFDGKEIVNMGTPFNSAYDDQSFVLDGQFGYMASDRPEGNGGFDIYRFLSESTVPEDSVENATISLENSGVEKDTAIQFVKSASDDILKSSIAANGTIPEVMGVDTSEAMTASLSSKPVIETNFNPDDIFQSGPGQITSAIKYYQNLSGTEKKFADRIIALRNVNEQYVLHPALSNNDRQYFLSLRQADQLRIRKLAHFFEFGNSTQAEFNKQDLDYLQSLNSDERNRILRLATRIGLGMDKDNYVAFSDLDWNHYKKLPEGEINQMKTVARVLKENDQSFSLTLADGYVESDPSIPVLAKYELQEEQERKVSEAGHSGQRTAPEESKTLSKQEIPAATAENSQVNENKRTGGGGVFSISVQDKQKADPDVYHVVEQGETLKSIARDYDKKPRTLRKLNNIKGNKLKPGIKLLIERHQQQ